MDIPGTPKVIPPTTQFDLSIADPESTPDISIELLDGDAGRLSLVEELDTATAAGLEHLEEVLEDVGSRHRKKCPQPMATLAPDSSPESIVYGDPIRVFLHGQCSNAYNFIIHFLKSAPVEHSVIISLCAANLNHFDMVALADAVDGAICPVTVIVGTINDISSLVLISKADRVYAATPQHIQAPRNIFAVGSESQVESTLVGQKKYLDGVFDRLLTAGLLDEPQIATLRENTSGILVSSAKLQK